jgi:Zn ribbon nucleic-acid-binding protein
VTPTAPDYGAFLAADYTVSWCCPSCGVHGRITEAQRDYLESIHCQCGYHRRRLARKAPGYQREDADSRG